MSEKPCTFGRMTLCYTASGKVPYVKHFRWHADHCHLPAGKVKAVPLEAWSDPEGSRKLRFPDFMTTAQDGG
jgi:hypothetical protein